jgi:lysophospholipase L1-like esterase
MHSPWAIEPFWTSFTMNGESLFLIGDEDRATATLLFPPERIVSVTSATGELEYEDGRDYTVDYQSGCIIRFAGSRMPFTSNAELSPLTPGSSAMPKRNASSSGLMSAEGDVFHRRQVAVTYIHQPNLWRGPIPRFAGRALANTFSRLTAFRRLAICLMGDSISEGYNASGFTGVAPLQPPFGQLVAAALERAYGATVSFHNFAVAGSTADNGVWETTSVSKAQPDLVLIAYGMNDAGYASAADFVGRIQKIMGEIRSRVPDAEFVLVAPMLPHREWDYVVEGRIPEYRDALAALCDEGIVLADVTSLWSALLTRKSHYDLSGNGINHPNDFGHRMYAETILGLLIET